MTPLPPQTALPWTELALALLGGLVLAVLVTLPAWTAPHPVVIGMPESEAYSGAWVLWWAQEELLRTGAAPVVAPWLNAPSGRPLHALPLLDAVLTMPLRGLHAAVVHNLVAVWELGLAFAGAWWLLRSEGASRATALPGAVAYATTPALLSTLAAGPIEGFAIGWIPICLVVVRRALAEGGARWVAGAVLCLAATFLGNPYHLIFAATVGAPLTAWENRGRPWRPWLLRGLVIGGVALVLVVPQLLAIAYSSTVSPRASDAALEAELRNTHFVRDLLAFLLPTERWDPPGVPHRVYLGLVVVGLGLGGLRRSPRWMLVAGAALVFALGDVISVGGWRLAPNPLTLAMHAVPPWSELSSAFRAGVLVVLGCGVAGGRALRALPDRLQLPAAAGLTVLVLVDQLALGPSRLPVPVADARVPAFYRQLELDDAEVVVVDLVLDEGLLNPSRALLYQTVHRQRMLVDLLPPTPPLDQNPLVQLVQWDPRGAPAPPLRDLCGGVRALQDIGLRFIVAHRRGDTPGREIDPRMDRLRACGWPLAVDDGEVQVIDLDGAA